MSKISSRGRRLRQLCVILLAVATTRAGAQQFSILTGPIRDKSWNDDAYAYTVSYSEPLSKLFSYSLAYVNEGQLTDHHRDGLAAQLWAGVNFTPRWSAKAGIGPYLYFDTASRPGVVYSDDHAVGIISSVSTQYQFTKHWGVELRANRILTHKSIDTTSILVGVGYTFDASVLPGSAAGDTWWQSDRHRPNEIGVYVGKTVVNNFESETARAYQIEYRRSLSRQIDWTVSALHEGAPGPLDRRGVATQIWATRELFDNRATIGAGFGPYIARDSNDNDNTRVLPMLSLTAGLKMPGNFIARVTWNRVATRNDRDTDVVLIGAGYRW